MTCSDLQEHTDFSGDIDTSDRVCTTNHTSHDDDDLKPLLQSVSQCVVHDISSTPTDGGVGTMLLEKVCFYIT